MPLLGALHRLGWSAKGYIAQEVDHRTGSIQVASGDDDDCGVNRCKRRVANENPVGDSMPWRMMLSKWRAKVGPSGVKRE